MVLSAALQSLSTLAMAEAYQTMLEMAQGKRDRVCARKLACRHCNALMDFTAIDRHESRCIENPDIRAQVLAVVRRDETGEALTLQEYDRVRPDHLPSRMSPLAAWWRLAGSVPQAGLIPAMRAQQRGRGFDAPLTEEKKCCTDRRLYETYP